MQQVDENVEDDYAEKGRWAGWVSVRCMLHTARYEQRSATQRPNPLTLPDKVQQHALAAEASARVLEQMQDKGGEIEQGCHDREHEQGPFWVDETRSIDLDYGEHACDEYEEIWRVELLDEVEDLGSRNELKR